MCGQDLASKRIHAFLCYLQAEVADMWHADLGQQQPPFDFSAALRRASEAANDIQQQVPASGTENTRAVPASSGLTTLACTLALPIICKPELILWRICFWGIGNDNMVAGRSESAHTEGAQNDAQTDSNNLQQGSAQPYFLAAAEDTPSPDPSRRWRSQPAAESTSTATPGMTSRLACLQ